jgi:NNP family nitrate/nitrite transporter-like MFS transporter
MHISRYRWYILALIVATSALVSAVPFACLPSLFQEISDDLGLSLVQVGSIWGMVSLAGIFFSMLAGIAGDRFGVMRVIAVSCLMSGILGASRGLSQNFTALVATVFIHGIARVMIPINVTKAIGIWFRGEYLGLANGIGAMGMGLGLMLGPMLSASILSPALGGWRNVLYLYGGINVLFGLFWFLFGREPKHNGEESGRQNRIPFKQAFSKVIRIKSVWLLGLTVMLRMGAIQGLTGYLPLYLRGLGWEEAAADGALSAFYATSTLLVIPLSSLSDKLHSRKIIMMPAVVVTIVSLGILPFVDGAMVWILMIVSGCLMDAFMAIMTTMIIETEGVRPEYLGTAMGIAFTIAQVGGVLAPPIGNSMAEMFSPGAPFLFWAGLSLVSFFTMAAVKETAKKNHV